MQAAVDHWTIVIAGSWNVAILNPDWIAQKIFKTTEVELELLVQGLTQNIRITHGNVRIIPRPDRVLIACVTHDAETLTSAEAAAISLVNELPVTPVSAVGINFGFQENDPGAGLVRMINFEDNPRLAEKGLLVQSSTISRQLQMDDRIVNLSIDYRPETGMLFKYNYHMPVESAIQVVDAINGKCTEFLEQSLDILRDVYGLEEDANEQ